MFAVNAENTECIGENCPEEMGLSFPEKRYVLSGNYFRNLRPMRPTKKASEALTKLLGQMDKRSYIREQRKDDKEYKMLRRLRSEKSLTYPNTGKKAKSLMRFGKRNQYMVLRKGRETLDYDDGDLIAFIEVNLKKLVIISFK